MTDRSDECSEAKLTYFFFLLPWLWNIHRSETNWLDWDNQAVSQLRPKSCGNEQWRTGDRNRSDCIAATCTLPNRQRAHTATVHVEGAAEVRRTPWLPWMKWMKFTFHSRVTTTGIQHWKSSLRSGLWFETKIIWTPPPTTNHCWRQDLHLNWKWLQAPQVMPPCLYPQSQLAPSGSRWPDSY